uniref:glucan 1,4-alpha-glucosidase n=1 Tax=viral metagenome TaxID=1070528 RepID=A0A6C0EK46_9ZZZZ
MYQFKKISNLCILKIKNNIYKNVLYASPSYNPPYRYYWIRDGALVYKCIIDNYILTKDPSFLELLVSYVENETKIQASKTISGLGEPKINLDLSPFNGSWGRPQNDGPPLRGLNMIKLYNTLIETYESMSNKIILPIIYKDIDYIIENYDKPCYDLWEENYGWHFYTRCVQFKCIKEFINFSEKYNINYKKDRVTTVYTELQSKLKHHLDYSIISSFGETGEIIKKNDASIILALCHTDYDATLLEIVHIDKFIKVGEELTLFFKNKYTNNHYNLIGRYENDHYYTGHIWIICSLALAQLYLYNSYNKIGVEIINYVLSIDSNLDLSEQYDVDNEQQLSAKNLSWNYSELYFSYKLLSKIPV